MRRITCLTCLALVAMLLATLLSAQPPRTKGTQYAFLVACSGYDKTQLRPLPYTINDIEGFREALLATGFDGEHIKLLHDKRTERRYQSEKAKILRELNLLLDGLKEEDTVVVALSGHGVHFKGDKSGYFCPVDAKLADKKTLLPMEGDGGLFELLKGCKAKKKLLIVNACRNDPASDLAQAANKINLDDEDKEEVPEGIAALYSCRQGQKSYFDPERQRGIFFDHVIRAWKGEYQKGGELKLEDFFQVVVTKTKTDVDKTLGEAQVPVVRRDYIGEWLIGAARRLVERGAKEVVVDLGGGVKMEFVRIPAGKFRMGSPKDEKDRDNDEEQHEVEITRAFYLGKYEVTQEQYQQIVGTNPSYFSPGGEGKENVKDVDTRRFPVEKVSWDEATAFCDKLSAQDGKRRFRLPTEAEWEYACRAGTATAFHFGSSLNGDKANCNGNNPYGTSEKGRYRERPCGVGSYAANAFGLHDMHGNVLEWCQDWYGPYSGLAEKDPLRTEKVDDSARVLRGGSWNDSARLCRAADRLWLAPATRHLLFGFRVAFRLD